MEGYGERLKKLRGNKTLETVASAIGISRSALAMYETEERVPRDDIKIRLAEYFKTTVQKLFFTYKCHDMRH